MSSVRVLTVRLPYDVAEAAEEKVRSGVYSSLDDVVQQGVRALLDGDAFEERWLRDEVVQSCREMEADPSQAIPLDEIMPRLRARRAKV